MKIAFALLAVFFLASIVTACDAIYINPRDSFASIVSLLSVIGLILSTLSILDESYPNDSHPYHRPD